MRKWMKKWGDAAGALCCVLVILFAAVYTRQDDIRRLSAQNAAADQSQTLDSAQNAAAVCRPLHGKLLSPFIGAVRSEGGLWSFDPFAHYQAATGQEVWAIQEGVCTSASSQKIIIAHENALTACYSGAFTPIISQGDTVSVGQCIAHIQKNGDLLFSLQQAEHYIDPEAFFLSYQAK